jgi:hypothetical protein
MRMRKLVRTAVPYPPYPPMLSPRDASPSCNPWHRPDNRPLKAHLSLCFDLPAGS